MILSFAGLVWLTGVGAAHRWPGAEVLVRAWRRAEPYLGAYVRRSPATFTYAGIIFVTTWVARLESNGAGAAMVAAYTLVEAVLLAWLFNWNVHGATGWTFLVAGTLLAGVYNLLVCDFLAERLT